MLNRWKPVAFLHNKDPENAPILHTCYCPYGVNRQLSTFGRAPRTKVLQNARGDLNEDKKSTIHDDLEGYSG